jgi:predicted DNA-binding transcriptional regulator AlpA
MSVKATMKSSVATGRVTHTGDQPPVQPDLPPSLNRDRVLDSEQASNFLGMSLVHFRRLYRAKRVPPPIMIGYRKYGWQAGVLIDFVSAKTEKAAA